MKKTLTILILLFILTSCVQNKTNENVENTNTSVEKTFHATTTEKPTEILKENDYNYENISYLKDELNNLTLKKLEQVKTFHSGGRLPYVEHVRAEDYKEYKNDNFKHIYENENTDIISIYEFKNNDFGVGITEKNELYFINNGDKEFLFDYTDKVIIEMVATEKQFFFNRFKGKRR